MSPPQELRDLPVEAIEPNLSQPRRYFDEGALEALAALEVGLIENVAREDLNPRRRSPSVDTWASKSLAPRSASSTASSLVRSLAVFGLSSRQRDFARLSPPSCVFVSLALSSSNAT
jgi:hypothetical protein